MSSRQCPMYQVCYWTDSSVTRPNEPPRVSLSYVCHYRTCVTTVRVSLFESDVSLLKRRVCHVLLDSRVSVLERHVNRRPTGQSIHICVCLNVRLSKPRLYTLCPSIHMSTHVRLSKVSFSTCPRARPPARLPSVGMYVCVHTHTQSPPTQTDARTQAYTYAHSCKHMHAHTHTRTHMST